MTSRKKSTQVHSIWSLLGEQFPNIYLMHSGRRPMYGDAKVDSNCNGIYGTNKTSGIPLEEELCGGSGQRGIIYIGDSVGAHFRAPPQWFPLAPIFQPDFCSPCPIDVRLKC